jgi:hypothetical protein
VLGALAYGNTSRLRNNAQSEVRLEALKTSLPANDLSVLLMELRQQEKVQPQAFAPFVR